MFYEIGIRPHHAGFGMWNVDEANGAGWAAEQDLLDEIAANVYEIVELGEQTESEIEDIRGKIYNEPARVFAVRDTEDAEVSYLGIVEKD